MPQSATDFSPGNADGGESSPTHLLDILKRPVPQGQGGQPSHRGGPAGHAQVLEQDKSGLKSPFQRILPGSY